MLHICRLLSPGCSYCTCNLYYLCPVLAGRSQTMQQSLPCACRAQPDHATELEARSEQLKQLEKKLAVMDSQVRSLRDAANAANAAANAAMELADLAAASEKAALAAAAEKEAALKLQSKELARLGFLSEKMQSAIICIWQRGSGDTSPGSNRSSAGGALLECAEAALTQPGGPQLESLSSSVYAASTADPWLSQLLHDAETFAAS